MACPFPFHPLIPVPGTLAILQAAGAKAATLEANQSWNPPSFSIPRRNVLSRDLEL